MSLTVVKGLQSEIFVPITPPMVWTPVEKELKDMTVALATAAGVHQIDQERFNLAGDFTWRKIDDKCPSDKLMVSHGGYDNSDVNKDINCMFPIDRLHELVAEGFIKATAPYHAGFMGGGGNQEKFKHETGPAVAAMLKEEGVDAAILPTALQYWCRERLKRLEFLQLLLQPFHQSYVRLVHHVRLLRWFRWELMQVVHTMWNSRQLSLKLLFSSWKRSRHLERSYHCHSSMLLRSNS